MTTLTAAAAAAATSNAQGGEHVRDTCGGFGATDGRADKECVEISDRPRSRDVDTRRHASGSAVDARGTRTFVFPFRNYSGEKKQGLEKKSDGMSDGTERVVVKSGNDES